VNESVIKCTDLVSPQRKSPPPFNLELTRNTLACLVGPNDSGKSLSLRLLGGIDEPAGGTLELLGYDVWQMDDRARRKLRKRVGYVLPNNGLLSTADALQNLSLPADYHDTDTAEGVARRAHQLLQWLDCPSEYYTRPAAELPPCYQRLVAIARCLMLNPEILFVDDAFAFCDRAMQSRLAARYVEMKKQLKMTLVLATDDMEFAQQYADVLLYILPQGLRIHDRQGTGPDEFLHLLNQEGVDDYTRAIEG
jgi:ABC-type lipoprotein export system ATPase subunit